MWKWEIADFVILAILRFLWSEMLPPGLTKRVFDGAENRVNDILSPSPTREGVPFLVSPGVKND
jgi:hypothetical protein